MQDYYSQTAENGYSSIKAGQLINLVKTAIKKNEKSLAILSDRLMESKDYEDDRIKGELLTANLYKLRQGMDKITVDNYYTGSSETILLDPTLSPQKNAQKYYKAYNKKKTAIAKSQEQIAIAREKADYFDSILASLMSADDDTTLAEIAIEMESAGIIKKAGAKKKRKPSSPHTYTVKGYKVLIGKNNVQNDNLVRQSEGGWLWLHTQKIHGSHGIIQATNIPQEIINEVASMVAHYSKASMSANVPVDYTLVKYVKKPSGSPPGKVIYTHQQTVNVTPKKPNN
jgi:predicted ribosome quality control (RQC) complex YloA/Tae2 family protein